MTIYKCKLLESMCTRLGIVEQACKHSTREAKAEARESLQVWGQPG